jgi:hypothetical protein
VLTNAVRYADPGQGPVADVLDAARRLVPIGPRKGLDSGERWLKEPAEMARIVERVAEAAGFRRDTAHRLLAMTEETAAECLVDAEDDLGIGAVHFPEPHLVGAGRRTPQRVLASRAAAAMVQGALRHGQARGDAGQPHRLRREHHRPLGRPRPDLGLRHRAQRLDPHRRRIVRYRLHHLRPGERRRAADRLRHRGVRLDAATTPTFSNVTASAAGTKLVDITYASGGSTARKATIQVNGQYKCVVAFPPTGGPVPGRLWRGNRQRQQADPVDLQRPGQPEVDPHLTSVAGA